MLSMLSREDKMAYQDLLSSKAWSIFRERVVGAGNSLRTQVQNKVNASARSADWEKTAYYTGQLDILNVVMDLPSKELQKTSLNS